MSMKKLLFVLLSIFVLIACSPNDETVSDSSNEVDINGDDVEKLDDMTKKDIMAYIDQMVGKYLKLGTYEPGSAEEQDEIDEILTDINLAISDMEAKYESNISIVKDFKKLADSVRDALDNWVDGEYEAILNNSKEIGSRVAEISRNYLDGETPDTLKDFLDD